MKHVRYRSLRFGSSEPLVAAVDRRSACDHPEPSFDRQARRSTRRLTTQPTISPRPRSITAAAISTTCSMASARACSSCRLPTPASPRCKAGRQRQVRGHPGAAGDRRLLHQRRQPAGQDRRVVRQHRYRRRSVDRHRRPCGSAFRQNQRSDDLELERRPSSRSASALPDRWRAAQAVRSSKGLRLSFASTGGGAAKSGSDFQKQGGVGHLAIFLFECEV